MINAHRKIIRNKWKLVAGFALITSQFGDEGKNWNIRIIFRDGYPFEYNFPSSNLIGSLLLFILLKWWYWIGYTNSWTEDNREIWWNDNYCNSCCANFVYQCNPSVKQFHMKYAIIQNNFIKCHLFLFSSLARIHKNYYLMVKILPSQPSNIW